MGKRPHQPRKQDVITCERCGRILPRKDSVTCLPNFAAPALDVCVECADIMQQFEDYLLPDCEDV